MNLMVQSIETKLAEQGMTKKALAEKCGISPQNISTIIRRGTCEPKTAGKLAVGLGVPVADIPWIRVVETKGKEDGKAFHAGQESSGKCKNSRKLGLERRLWVVTLSNFLRPYFRKICWNFCET